MEPQPVRRAAALLLRPFETFFRLESASGILLLASAAAALAWANSPWAASYFHLWETPLAVGLGDRVLSLSLHYWINDGLMAVFFFVVGLEIKRELLLGELAAPRKAALSVAAAMGGMLVPAAIYALVNLGGPGAAGWGIPMATDIAFALGVLALLGRRVPVALKVFLTAVAIVDDLGAVLVIALFYTAEIAAVPLAFAGGLFGFLLILNRAGVRVVTVYAALGVAVWLAFLFSGVHATVAGVLVAMAVPARGRIHAPEYLERAERYLAEFAEDARPGVSEPTTDQHDSLHSLEAVSRQLESPLYRLEHGLHPWVAFGIVPLFALANAGVALGGGAGAALTGPVSAGVILGLFLGKQVGVLGAAWLVVRSGVAHLPAGVGWRQLWGVALLCGIGFTMSLFIAGLAFEDPALLDRAKVGILAGSLISGVAGGLVLARSGRAAARVGGA